MGRSLRPGKQAHASTSAAEEQPWWEGVAGNARAHGALPYVVEGFRRSPTRCGADTPCSSGASRSR